MPYFPPFELLKRFASVSTVRGEVWLSLSYTDFMAMLRLILATVDVDETWYLHIYEDIAKAVHAGTVASARQHFIDDGYFEGRLPGPHAVDEAWYLRAYPDVADSIRRGLVVSAQQHFEQDGFREGRLPREM